MPRRSAERRGRPQADVRGNAKHSWRSPHWPRTRMRSSEVPVRILPFAPFGAPPPLIFLEANAFVQWLGKARAQKTRRENRRTRHCERSEAIQGRVDRLLDCFVAALLAMTAFLSAPARSAGEGDRAKRGGRGPASTLGFRCRSFVAAKRRRSHHFTMAARVSSRPAPPPPSCAPSTALRGPPPPLRFATRGRMK